jgi:DtxR family transcriptional regulator, Mn-dependent transcriptional regulator
MADESPTIELTGALEDYLETVFELVRDRKLARIRDIAKARSVKSGSVSPAMRRLADLGLVNYIEREYIDLTADGERLARRIYAKHQVLNRFFQKILKMPPAAALENACAMEHSLSDDAMDHLVRFFEFLDRCPEGGRFLERFHKCALLHQEGLACAAGCPLYHGDAEVDGKPLVSILALAPGERARICQIVDTGEIRRQLLEKGIVPDAKLELLTNRPDDDDVTINLQGFQLTLSKAEAGATMVVPL